MVTTTFAEVNANQKFDGSLTFFRQQTSQGWRTNAANKKCTPKFILQDNGKRLM